MQEAFKFEWKGNNAIITYIKETISLQDIIVANDLIYGNRKFDSMRYQLFDLSAVEELDFVDEIATVVASLDTVATSWNKNIKVATVGQSDSVMKLLEAYNLKMLKSPWETKSFKNVEEALEWCEKD